MLGYDQYHVKVCVTHHSDLTMELPFTLTHPEPEHKVICGMVTLPRRKSTVGQQPPVDDNTDQQTDNTTTGSHNNHILTAVYVEIFKGHKICRFHCKLLSTNFNPQKEAVA